MTVVIQAQQGLVHTNNRPIRAEEGGKITRHGETCWIREEGWKSEGEGEKKIPAAPRGTQTKRKGRMRGLVCEAF